MPPKNKTKRNKSKLNITAVESDKKTEIEESSPTDGVENNDEDDTIPTEPEEKFESIQSSQINSEIQQSTTHSTDSEEHATTVTEDLNINKNSIEESNSTISPPEIENNIDNSQANDNIENISQDNDSINNIAIEPVPSTELKAETLLDSSEHLSIATEDVIIHNDVIIIDTSPSQLELSIDASSIAMSSFSSVEGMLSPIDLRIHPSFIEDIDSGMEAWEVKLNRDSQSMQQTLESLGLTLTEVSEAPEEAWECKMKRLDEGGGDMKAIEEIASSVEYLNLSGSAYDTLADQEEAWERKVDRNDVVVSCIQPPKPHEKNLPKDGYLNTRHENSRHENSGHEGLKPTPSSEQSCQVFTEMFSGWGFLWGQPIKSKK